MHDKYNDRIKPKEIETEQREKIAGTIHWPVLVMDWPGGPAVTMETLTHTEQL